MLPSWLSRTTPLGLFFFLISAAAAAQSPVPKSFDSLEAYVRTVKIRDTNYVKALNELAWQLLGTTAPTRADSLAEVAEKTSISLRYGPGLFDSYSRRGRLFYLQSQYPKAMTFYEKAADVVRRQRLGPVYQQTALADLAMINLLTGNQQKALDLALQSIRVYESAPLPKLKGSPYEVAADVFRQTGKREEALTYLKRSLVIKTRDGSTDGVTIAESRIGGLLNDMERYSEAIPHLERARRIRHKTNNAMHQVDVAMNLSASYRFLNQHSNALKVLQAALPFAQLLGEGHSQGGFYGNLGLVYLALKKYPLAEHHLLDALRQIKAVGSPEYENYLNEALMELYAETGNYRKAYQYQRQVRILEDSLHSVSTQNGINELKTKFDTERKEQQIKLLQQQSRLDTEQIARQNLQRNGLLGGGLLVLLTAGLGVGLVMNRQRVKKLEEAERLRNQIAADLHDEIGSTLSSISMLSGLTDTRLGENQPEAARTLVQKIQSDARQTLDSMDEIIWTIHPGNDSLQRTALRMQEYAQPLIEAKNIQFHFYLDPDLPDEAVPMDTRRAVYLIGKEAINNLVKHSAATEASLRFERQKEHFTLTIADNGRGFDPTQPSARTGQRSMRERADVAGGRLDVQAAPGRGTRLVVTMPLMA